MINLEENEFYFEIWDPENINIGIVNKKYPSGYDGIGLNAADNSYSGSYFTGKHSEQFDKSKIIETEIIAN